MVQNELYIKELFRKRLLLALKDCKVPGHGRDVWIAKAMGVTPKAVGKWTSGESMPRQARWAQLAELLNKPASYFYAEDIELSEGSTPHAGVEEDNCIYLDLYDSDIRLTSNEVAIPFFTEIEASAGNGKINGIESHSQKLRISKRILSDCKVNSGSAACIKVRGNSMEPALPDGSVIGIDTSNRIIVDGKIYAIAQGDMLRVKLLYRSPNGGIRLRSYNKEEHPDEHYSSEELSNILIIGKVFWSSVVHY